MFCSAPKLIELSVSSTPNTHHSSLVATFAPELVHIQVIDVASSNNNIIGESSKASKQIRSQHCSDSSSVDLYNFMPRSSIACADTCCRDAVDMM